MAKTAWVDLTSGEVAEERTDSALLKDFLGGRGIGAKLLFDDPAHDADPLSPDSPLILSVGPLTGSGWPAGTRYHVTFRSPLTGIYGYANGGGFFGPELARAGYDAIVIRGRAKEPVAIRVSPAGVAIEPANGLWGKETGQVFDVLGVDGSRVACIGPAGENLVGMAAIINDRCRAAARCGGGAVMGSKRLKAVVVRAGKGSHASNPPEFRRLAKRAAQRLRSDPRLEGLRRSGTSFLVGLKNISGDLPARNHQLTQVPHIKQVDADALQVYVQHSEGCFACPIRCARFTRIPDGPFACELGGPEYETIDALGPMCWLSDIRAIAHANERCNQLGLDTISTGVAIAFAMECHQRGLLEDDRLSLEWGDADTVLGLIERIAGRQGLGARLADGVRRAAESIGPEAVPLAMHVKGLELPRQEPRIAKGFGLGHAVSNRGADHLYGMPAMDTAGNLTAARRFFPEALVAQVLDTADETYKADMLIVGEHYCALSDALGVCKFSTSEAYSLLPEDLAEGLSALLGRSWSGDELMTVGERIVNLERLYNARLGLARRDDRLPLRFTSEPAEVYAFESAGSAAEMVRSARPVHTGFLRDFDAMLDRYYQLRGWDGDGLPTSETLRRLKLDNLSGDSR